jgi:hypothetical protein
VTGAERIADPTGQAILAMIREYAERYAIADATLDGAPFEDIYPLEAVRSALTYALGHHAAGLTYDDSLAAQATCYSDKDGREVIAALTELKRRIAETAGKNAARTAMAGPE